jgi:hypothetical protein
MWNSKILKIQRTLQNWFKILEVQKSFTWSYFGSRHGKGVHDGVKTILEQEIKKK